MSTISITIALVVMLQFLAVGAANATQNPQMRKYFNQRVTQVESVLQNTNTTNVPGPQAIRLTDINIDLAGLVSFGLSDVFKLTVSTEIDFVLVPDEPQ